MKPRTKFMLLMGAALATGGTTAIAAATAPPSAQPGDRFQSSGRSGAHFLADYDLNHDGKVTKDELNKAVSRRFAQASAGGGAVTAQQYAAFTQKEHRDRTAQFFRRADWNGDGKLSLDEYMAPLRAKFANMDRSGTGVIDCAHRNKPKANGFGSPNGKLHRRVGMVRGICPTNDFNQDGKVTRAEFDKVNAQKFAEIAHGAKALTFEQFLNSGRSGHPDVSGRIFQHLDANHDSKLVLAEFAEPQLKQFTRLDRNRDGVVTRDELAVPQSRGGGKHYSAGY